MMRHRKLFPSEPPNAALGCGGLCDPACPLNCYQLPDDVYILPPPPPPPSSDQQISPPVIIIVSVLAGVFLLVSYYVIFGKSFLERVGLRRRRQGAEEGELGGGGDDPNARGNDEEQQEVFVGRNQVHHPIWYIATVGLPQSLIDSIAVCKYKKGERLIEGTECSVCLSEFQDGETLRLLPKCNHAFHVSCIDTWLRSHTNCPLCRAHIAADAESAPDNQPGPVTVSISENENSVDDAADVAEDGVRDGGETENDNGEADNNNDSGEIEGYFGDSTKSAVVRKLRKSSSMDFLPDTILADEPTESVGSGSGSDSGSFRQPSCSSSIAQYLRKSPVSMKRSNSCGGRFFLTRINRSQSLILPL